MMTAVSVRKTFQTLGFLYISNSHSNAEFPSIMHHITPACTPPPAVSFLWQTAAMTNVLLSLRERQTNLAKFHICAVHVHVLWADRSPQGDLAVCAGEFDSCNFCVSGIEHAAPALAARPPEHPLPHWVSWWVCSRRPNNSGGDQD